MPTTGTLARQPLVWAAVACVLGTAAVAATLLLQRPPAAVVDAYAYANANAITALAQRCQTEMLRGTCTAMRADASTPAAQRVFIAGIGEVDGTAFAALRSAGDAMCGDVVNACSSDWQGNTCRIARALYPPRAQKS